MKNTVIAIVLDMARPWEILDHLEAWRTVIFALQEKVFAKLAPEQQERMRAELELHFKKFSREAAGDEEESKGEDGASDGSLSENEALAQLPLEEGVLTINIGIPLLVICNKADLVVHDSSLSEYFKTRYDFVMRHVRQFALMFGGAVFSTGQAADKATGL